MVENFLIYSLNTCFTDVYYILHYISIIFQKGFKTVLYKLNNCSHCITMNMIHKVLLSFNFERFRVLYTLFNTLLY